MAIIYINRTQKKIIIISAICVAFVAGLIIYAIKNQLENIDMLRGDSQPPTDDEIKKQKVNKLSNA